MINTNKYVVGKHGNLRCKKSGMVEGGRGVQGIFSSKSR